MWKKERNEKENQLRWSTLNRTVSKIGKPGEVPVFAWHMHVLSTQFCGVMSDVLPFEFIPYFRRYQNIVFRHHPFHLPSAYFSKSYKNSLINLT